MHRGIAPNGLATIRFNAGLADDEWAETSARPTSRQPKGADHEGRRTSKLTDDVTGPEATTINDLAFLNRRPQQS